MAVFLSPAMLDSLPDNPRKRDRYEHKQKTGGKLQGHAYYYTEYYEEDYSRYARLNALSLSLEQPRASAITKRAVYNNATLR